MAKDAQVIIYMREIKLDVVIPQDHGWDFMLEFGTVFPIHDTHSGDTPRPIDSYYYHPNGWHITVSVWERDESKFYDFLRKFCEKHSLTHLIPE